MVEHTMSMESIGPNIVGGALLRSLDITTVGRRLRAGDAVPGMLSFPERAMLQELVRTTWRGDGAIVDGGTFFGSSLVASAEGMLAGEALHDAPASRFPGGKPLHGYDLGYLPAPANEKVDRRRVISGVEYYMGDSFLPILEKAVAPYSALIELHIGDLLDEKWDGSPIEIAFIDVCKTIRLNAHVSKEFYPALIPGASTLINQDFFFDRLPWIKVTMGYLKDYFTWEGQVFSSAVFRNTTAVPADVAAIDPFLEGTYEECLELHDAIEFAGIDRRHEYLLWLSRAYLMALKNRKDEALDTLSAVLSTYADLLDDEDNPRGNRFRYDRAWRQISNGNIFKVS